MQGGWIPRIIHGIPYSVDIKQPDVRYGSIWFRVQPVDGVKVRVGPSQRSPVIKTENCDFQFECGEYLRASQILTIHGHADIESTDNDEMMKVEHPSESFAKLYRHNSREEPSNYKSYKSYEGMTLNHLSTIGEFVQIHCNGHLYLEECVNPPSFERHPGGWRYEVISANGINIRNMHRKYA